MAHLVTPEKAENIGSCQKTTIFDNSDLCRSPPIVEGPQIRNRLHNDMATAPPANHDHGLPLVPDVDNKSPMATLSHSHCKLAKIVVGFALSTLGKFIFRLGGFKRTSGRPLHRARSLTSSLPVWMPLDRKDSQPNTCPGNRERNLLCLCAALRLPSSSADLAKDPFEGFVGLHRLDPPLFAQELAIQRM